jgi:hypothetical protein
MFDLLSNKELINKQTPIIVILINATKKLIIKQSLINFLFIDVTKLCLLIL